jgi:hypothetical protein
MKSKGLFKSELVQSNFYNFLDESIDLGLQSDSELKYLISAYKANNKKERGS